jgi:1,4-dihydroxy-2-naphthoate octaprenyltransferase
MADLAQNSSAAEKTRGNGERFLCLAGVRYWTATAIPAVVGTTLPFWLRPPGFSFRCLGALEFLAATVLVQAGFSLLHAALGHKLTAHRPVYGLVAAASVCLTAACLLGIRLNGSIPPHNSVPSTIFVVWGLTALFAGILYVVPPFSFHRRAGGEVVLAEGLGMLPVLGAYLVQVGDLNRTVYLAAGPLVIATGLWVWADELVSVEADRDERRGTMVTLFGARFSARIGTLALALLFCVSLVTAVASASLNPTALMALLLVGLVGRIVVVSWNGYANSALMAGVRKNTFVLHFATGVMIAVSSLTTMLFGIPFLPG